MGRSTSAFQSANRARPSGASRAASPASAAASGVPDRTGRTFAAGLAVGFWRDLDELRALWQMKSEWRPTMAAKTRAKLLRKWQKAVQKSLDWIDSDDDEDEEGEGGEEGGERVE